ncbi:hypothetical protein OG948_22410 [Embleya sp. NBC_00888]|uniref:hypothetical protein n=1 Tax=Embleya sp. NBC_00888 TaxID=2975960 RepID=UPI003863352F|nr:hypothetical protein OG948_22410 [Embleya sp. NBC_00888]
MDAGRMVGDGRFEPIERLGAGGVGTVRRARDVTLGREVALTEVRAPEGLPAGRGGPVAALLVVVLIAAGVLTALALTGDDGTPRAHTSPGADRADRADRDRERPRTPRVFGAVRQLRSGHRLPGRRPRRCADLVGVRTSVSVRARR